VFSEKFRISFALTLFGVVFSESIDINGLFTDGKNMGDDKDFRRGECQVENTNRQ
jgi:hypothetical protein